jgi:hypothetical protein
MKYGKLAFMALAATLLVPAPKAEACFGKFGKVMSGFATMPFMLGAGVATAGFMGSKLFSGGFYKLFKGVGKKEKKKKKLAPCAFICKGLFEKPSKKAKAKKVKFPKFYTSKKSCGGYDYSYDYDYSYSYSYSY